MESNNKNTKNTDKGIIRVQKNKENPYVMINKGFLENVELSWKAKGLLTYLLSRPDNWQIYVSHLIKQSTDGNTAVRSALKELKTFGYLQKYPVRIGNKIVYWESLVYEIPFEENERIKSKKICDDEEIIIYEKPKSKKKSTTDFTKKGQKSVISQTQLKSLLAENQQVQNLQVQKLQVQNQYTNNKRSIINNDCNNKSINQSILDNDDIDNNSNCLNLERPTEGLNPIPNIKIDQYEKLLKDCGVQYYTTYKKAIIKALRGFFFTEDTTICLNGQILPVALVQLDLMDLDIHRLDLAISKFENGAKKKEIKNNIKYLQVCIYDAIFDYDIKNKKDQDNLNDFGPIMYGEEK